MKKRRFSKDNLVSSQSNIVHRSFLNSKNFGTVVVIGIILIMVFSAFAIGYYNDGNNVNTVEYNGLKFTNRDGVWVFNLNNAQYGLQYLPSEVENIESISLSNENFGDRIYLIHNPDQFPEDSLELNNLRDFLVSRSNLVFLACSKFDGCGDFPVLSCKDVNNTAISLINGNQTKIYKQDNCVVLEARPGEENLLFTRLIYSLLRVIND